MSTIIFKYFIIVFSLFATSFFQQRPDCTEGNKQVISERKFLDCDSIQTLDPAKIDLGFTNQINLVNTETYLNYQAQVIHMKGAAIELLQLRFKNAQMGITFTTDRQVNKILYYSIKEHKQEGKSFTISTVCQTKNYGFKINDSFFYCLKRLEGVDYTIQKRFDSSLNFKYVIIHGLIKNTAVKATIFDEYMCLYRFKKSRLDLI